MEITKVSVVIPAYNCEKNIEKTLQSVLDQSVSTEIIIVNDCSTDATEDIIKKYLHYENIIYIANKRNMGVACSRNIGVNMTKCKYIAYLDSDDCWHPKKLEKQLRIMEENKFSLCYTGRRLIDEEGKNLGKVIHAKEYLKFEELLRHNCISCSSVLLLRKIALAVPMCHDEYHEDYINWLKILKKYGMAYGIDEPLLIYRMTKNGKSRNRLKSAKMTYGTYQYIGYGKLKSILLTTSHLIHGIMKY